MSNLRNFSRYFLLALFLMTIALVSLLYFEKGRGKLIVSFLNIGQGDAILIIAPNGAKMLLDSGPDSKVISELGKFIPFYDHSIDAIMVSNPDSDHIAGFLDVLTKYKVSYDIEPGTISPSSTFNALEKSVLDHDVKRIIARRGMDIVLDEKDGVDVKILFPDRDVTKDTTNNGSIIAKLIYKNTSVLLEGDAPKEDEYHLLSLDPKDLDVDILKTGHHGSRTSTAKEYVEAASPEYAVISCGVDNHYGHPHKETLDTLNSLGVPILRTDTMGTITFESDGNKFYRK